MKTLKNRQLSENQRSEIFDMAESHQEMFGGSMISNLKSAMTEMFMQACLVEKLRTDCSKMSVSELHGYAHDGEVYDHLTRSYK